VDLPLAITRLLRLQQIVGGHLPDGTLLPCPRLDELVARVAADVESGMKVNIWARFVPEVQRIKLALGNQDIAAVTYTGYENATLRKLHLHSFQHGSAQVLIGTQAAGGVGLDMTAGSRVYFYSNTFSYEERVQAEDRNHRIGQRNPVVYTDMYCADTVDRLILAAIQRKQDVAAMVSMREIKELV
jgi:SNF2 family DNA or RNA helicase